jgi:hypothetical protein
VLTASGAMYHLQLPPRGNGRSRAEWVSALADVAASARGGYSGQGPMSGVASEVSSPTAISGGGELGHQASWGDSARPLTLPGRWSNATSI